MLVFIQEKIAYFDADRNGLKMVGGNLVVERMYIRRKLFKKHNSIFKILNNLTDYFNSKPLACDWQDLLV